jgi:outer membrane protein TolC
MFRYLTITLLIAAYTISNAQQAEVVSVTLKQAIETAKRNNQSYLNSRLDQEAAQKRIKEIRSIGLPQVNAEARFTYTPQIPKIGIPNPFPGPGQPEILEFPQGIDYAVNSSITASQLLFDGSFFMGLKAAKEFAMLSRYSTKSSEQQMENSIAKAYYMVLIAEESLKLIDAQLVTIEKTRNDVLATYKAGLVEKVEADRLELSYSNLSIAKRQVVDGRMLAYYTLKMQMGMRVKDSIVLADNLTALYEMASTEPEINTAVNYSSRPEYKMIEQQERLFQLDKNRYQYGYMPTLSAFAIHQQNAFGREFSPTFNRFFPGTLVGVNLSVPIFDGLNKSAKIQTAKINLQKTANDKAMLENVIELEVYSARTNYLRSRDLVAQQDRNLKLADEIYKNINRKYTNGLSSSLDLISAERDLKEAQKNYLDAIYEFLMAKADLKKALGEK